MQLKYGSQNLVLEKKRIRFTDKKYKCIRNYDGRGEEGEEGEEVNQFKL